MRRVVIRGLEPTLMVLAILAAVMLISAAARPRATPVEDQALKTFYHDCNRDYFSSALPKDVRIQWDRTLDDVELVGAWDGHKTIRLTPKLKFSDALARMVVLHEMAHIAKPRHQDHDDVFQQEMLRLAHAGAFRDLW